MERLRFGTLTSQISSDEKQLRSATLMPRQRQQIDADLLKTENALS
jgi:hypothetical protein